MGLIKPKKLKQGDTIAIVAPSSYCPPEDVVQVKTQIEALGYKVVIHDQCHSRDFASAGTVEQKIKAIHDVFADPSIDAVFALRGGYQTSHLLDKIDYDLIRKNPKIFIGYSDITALHFAFNKQASLVTFHGTNARGFRHLSEAQSTNENKSNQAMLDMLSGRFGGNLFRDHPAKILKPGKVSGKIIGGNTQLIAALIESGEAYHPDFKDAILVIEDISEEITKLDRQFGAWRLRGLFKQIAGLVVGYMTDIKDTPGVAGPFVYTVEDILVRHTGDLKGPLVVNAPFGHEDPNYPFPQGIRAELDASGATAKLSLLESPFADA